MLQCNITPSMESIMTATTIIASRTPSAINRAWALLADWAIALRPERHTSFHADDDLALLLARAHRYEKTQPSYAADLYEAAARAEAERAAGSR
jgi:acyl-CoA synthetase (NDP forming)